MFKSYALILSVTYIAAACNGQLFQQQTSKPFFPSSPSSSASGPINFDSIKNDDDFEQKPAVIPPPNDPFAPQQPAIPVSPSAPPTAFSKGPESPVPPQSQDRQHIDPRFCTKIQDPVCGSNGRTYGNLCMLTQDQRSDPSLTVSKKGEC